MAPGVFSPIAAQLAVQTGFTAGYFSGGAFANLLGLPDLGVTTLSEVGDAAMRITSVVDDTPHSRHRHGLRRGR